MLMFPRKCPSRAPYQPVVQPGSCLFFGVQSHANGGVAAYATGVGGPRQLLARKLNQAGIGRGEHGAPAAFVSATEELVGLLGPYNRQVGRTPLRWRVTG